MCVLNNNIAARTVFVLHLRVEKLKIPSGGDLCTAPLGVAAVRNESRLCFGSRKGPTSIIFSVPTACHPWASIQFQHRS